MKINYVIGRYWPKKWPHISSYSEFGECHYDEEKNAFAHARRLSQQEGKEYRVFELMDRGTYFDPDPC